MTIARRPSLPHEGKPPFGKVLIANRGEIAVRIIRSCHEMGIRTIAIYSDADRDALHVRMAHQACHVGPPESTKSYLNIERIVDEAKKAGADAVHPGYGFLSENADFARACKAAGLVFIGPPPESMEAVGDKVRARTTMEKAGVPLVPGTPPLSDDTDEVAKHAKKIGYPVLLKAAAGGGGKGMRIVREPGELASNLAQARGEAGSAFGDPTVFLEKFVERPRHIEIQVIADEHGNYFHLGERECSIQRRYQKLIEESPSVIVDEKTRKEVGEMAIRAVRAVGYTSAGTVEFLRGDDGSFYFMEVNARLQVEHPVTEMVTGVDLVKAMIQVAAGQKLDFDQEKLGTPKGHAIECRIIAEDPERNFMPSPGTIGAFRAPAGPGVRYDDGTYSGYTVPIYYDPMIAKLITWGRDRPEAITRMARALDELRVDGLQTSVSFHRKVMANEAFRAGDLHTGFLDEHPELTRPDDDPWLNDIALIAASIAHFRRLEQRSSANKTGSGETPRSRWQWADRGAWR